MTFEVTSEFLENLSQLIDLKKDAAIKVLFEEVHAADIAEILNDVDFDEAIYIIKLLDSEKTSEILTELDEDTRTRILENLSAKEIADEIGEMYTDDAAYILSELSEERQKLVINELVDDEHAADIKELLSYKDNTAGALMAKELVKVYETWTVAGCLRKIRRQAKHVSKVHSIYVVDKKEKLVGRLSLKDLIIAKSDQKIADIYISAVDSVNVNEDDEEVAKIMSKYDLEAIPVVDDNNILLGRITIDDIVDVLKEEADRDYQLAAGLTQDVDSDDSILDLTKARLPWLILALFGGFISVSVLGGFGDAMKNFPELFFFTPLIAAMAGNVGVQSSAIIVQGLANNSLRGSLVKRLFKEVLLSLLNGFFLAILLMSAGMLILGFEFKVGLTVAISLISVIIIASIIGTFVPIILDKKNIDPALATGPFITTSNDILGILIYFLIAKTVLGF
ncbi:MAG: magnesium transporter [Flavobacteriia bacterium]|nr:magnesium transporter [Flavobacteriia bacterium]OIP45525.1 MAG: magnesium transporter [Flavobacteriaceae bacterium CG2_30_31_66]PIV96777.1 MAG: magnesium transporter [Flavobacteriaceae bacterium CG17_big_fil_post_rev_8_21_14_2_50_31_13]PIX13453.1 MAG: magnesium transporter [Flavobacteriaceae bacterium CG_4_8_14_3_um_filter_31_8]PIY14951.1 MAG: magnesium transporter [Flavobacteriaceae bacterium CG_4_10_14_3_um_filter_31_253]PIZ11643.1 MAG: magnesium transporter [Flavobacteriaceae bacterium C